MNRIIAAFLVFSLHTPNVSGADTPTTGPAAVVFDQNPTDLQLSAQVRSELLSTPELKGLLNDVQVAASDGHVTLLGQAKDDNTISAITNRAAQVPGVISVTSQLALSPWSPATQNRRIERF